MLEWKKINFTILFLKKKLDFSDDDNWILIDETNKCHQEAIDDNSLIRTTTINECASICQGVTPMFAFGTNEFGAHGCSEGLCKCYCLDKMNDATCQNIAYDDFWFLKFENDFQKDGKLFIIY